MSSNFIAQVNKLWAGRILSHPCGGCIHPSIHPCFTQNTQQLATRFQDQLADANVAEVAALAWALPRITRPYTQ
jgi:hypothetical protein